MNAVFIPCETKVREFDSRMLLGYHLALAGFEVYIGSKGGIKREIFNTKNAIYLPKSVSKTELAFYKKLKENNTKIVLLHAEGGIYYKDFKESIIYCYPLEIVPYIDLIFVFGQEIKKAIHEFLPSIDQSKVIVSGDPRFDLLKPEYRPLFKKVGNEIVKKYKNYILINTSFGLANPRTGHKWVMDYYSNSPDITDLQREHIFLKIKVTTEVMNNFMIFAKKLAKARPDLNIILRPHPEESLAIYLKEFEGISNLFPVLEGSAQNWIFSAKAVVHYDCTTGVESVIAGKQTFAYVPIKDEAILAWLPVYLSKEFNSDEQLVETLAKTDFNKSELFKLEDDKKNTLAGFVNNILENSSEIIAGNVKTKIHQSSTQKSSSLILTLKRLKTYPNYYRAKRNAEMKNIKLKFPKVEQKEVLNHLMVFDAVHHNNNKFKAASLGLDVVKFSLK